jgi:hypothetical protein
MYHPLETRRGTGLHKIPSLREIWYRDAFSHSGLAATLEEWFDPAWLEDRYVAKSFHAGLSRSKGTRRNYI